MLNRYAFTSLSVEMIKGLLQDPVLKAVEGVNMTVLRYANLSFYVVSCIKDLCSSYGSSFQVINLYFHRRHHHTAVITTAAALRGCVKMFLMKSMERSSRESHRDKYADAIKKVKALGGHAGCHGHTKGSYIEIDCIKALLKADTGKWYVGTCNPNHRAAVQKVPNVGLLRIEGNAVVCG